MTEDKPTRKELQAKHGTPAEFEEACFWALDMITVEEAKEAVRKYNEEWAAAPDENA